MHDLFIQWASYGDGALAWAVITTLLILSGLIFVPRPAICILAGLTFGIAAFPLALIATAAGSLIGFVLARYLFRDWFLRMIERRPKAKLVADAIDSEGWQLLFLLRLASPIPGPVSNYAFGLSSMKMWQFMAVTLVGLAPQVFAFVYLGAVGQVALDDRSVSSTKLWFGIAGVVVLLLVIAMVTHRVRQTINARLGGAANEP
jgi:uncharacterized membrane protein YdjX (TVP38/TMEM64 family)